MDRKQTWVRPYLEAGYRIKVIKIDEGARGFVLIRQLVSVYGNPTLGQMVLSIN